MTYMDIRKFIRKHDMKPTTFGRLAVNDPKFVGDVQQGREISPRLEIKLRTFMDGYDDPVVSIQLTFRP